MIRKPKYLSLSSLYLIFLLISLSVGYWGEMLYMKPSNVAALKNGIEQNIVQERNEMTKELDRLLLEHKEKIDSADFVLTRHWTKMAETNRLFWIFKGDSLVFWNSNKVSFRNLNVFKNAPQPLRLSNANVFWQMQTEGVYTYLGVLPIRFVYPIENNYIQSYYNSVLGIPEFTPYSDLPNQGWTFIRDNDNGVLFHLDLNETAGKKEMYKLLGVIGYGLALLFLFLFWASRLRKIEDKKKRWYRVLLSFPFTFLFIALVGQLNAPTIFYETKLFSPEIFGMPGYFGNLGEILIFSLLWLGSCFLLSRYAWFTSSKKWINAVLLLILFVAFHELVRLYLSIVGHSTISFELNVATKLDVYSFIAHFILIALFGGWFLLLNSFISYLVRKSQLLVTLLISGIPFVILVLVYLGLGIVQMALPLFSGLILLSFAIFTNLKKRGEYTFLSLFLLAAMVAVLGISLTWSFSRELDNAKETTLLMNRASGIHNEHDPFAEMALMEINSKLQNDVRIKRFLGVKEPNIDELNRYIRSRYFSNSWRQYDIQLVLCWPDSELDIAGEDSLSNCYSYFQEMIAETGEELDGNGLFYLNNRNGRISYFIWHKTVLNDGSETSVFIDIESRLTSIGSGYPELVKDLDNDASEMDDYSFARYVDGVLISYSGDFSYNISGNWMSLENENEFIIQLFGGYKHLLYRPAEGLCYVLSKPEPQVVDVLLYFIYLFLYLFALIFAFSYLSNLKIKRPFVYHHTLETRIRAAILFVLLLSFLLVGFASVYYNFKQYRNEQIDSLKEKTRSVLVMLDEMTGEVGSFKELGNVDMVAYLRSISNSLYVDINLYNKAGQLVASSRPELFERRLQSAEINAKAFKDLNNEMLPWSLQNEYLGSKKYISAYKTIYNWDNKILGYVNLPHFISSDEARKDQMDFIVVLLNIYLIFVLLAILLTVVLSRQITRPLQVIKNKLSGIRLRERNEKIEYSGNDEIASLVNEYNRLIDELETGAEQLVNTERTSAWRHMARQIAHEIKNPLTPMKLSIQHLQRAKKDQHEKFDSFFDKTTATLIEQIENLSRIATEFSSFSKMSQSKPEKLDVNEPILSVVRLFKETENINVSLVSNPEAFYVWADKEQLMQVFNNLLKNAIQAFPQGKQGTIVVRIVTHEQDVLISVEDDGSGIAEEAKAKLFEPNFTTKRTGMGIGLGISRNIISSFNGEIWFEDNKPRGAIFFVKLPKYTYS